MTKDDSTARAMDSLRSIVRAIGGLSRTPAKSGISGAQLFALRQISETPGVSLGELARRTLARQSSVSELVARLDDRGLITRTTDSADARQLHLKLTAKGRRAIADSPATAQERLISGLEMLPRTKRAELADNLEAWLVASGFADVPPTMFFEKEGR
jgi:DNA-binding MarR family transcriptional regulator